MYEGHLHFPSSKRSILYIAVIVAISSISIISFIIILIPFPQQPITTKTSTDSNGVTKIYETKGGEQHEHYGFDYEYDERLNRTQFYLQNVPILNVEYTAYIKLNNKEKEDDDISFKIRGGEHNDDNRYAGRSYVAGVSFSGEPHLAKEYPYHPLTPSFPNEIKISDDGDTSRNIGNLNGRWIGLKVVIFNKENNVVNIEVYVDNKGVLSDGKPANEWRLWWTAVDDGRWVNGEGEKGGESYLDLQGKEGGTPEMMYIRIDKMKEKGQAEIKYESAREIDASNKLL